MSYIQPLFALALVLALVPRTSIRRQSPRPRSLNSSLRPLNLSPVTLLPIEIIQHIASFLSPCAAASFASTCLCIRYATGTQYLRSLRASRTEMFKLLELLVADAPNDPATDLPSRLLCVHCARIVPLYVGCGISATPACRETWDISRRYIESSFLPPLFFTAMAMHRHGRPYNTLLADSHFTPPTSTSYHRSNGVTSQYNARYHIATTGSLLLRRQIICILPHREGRTYRLHSIFCRHVGGQSNRISDAVALVQTEARSGIRRSLSKFYQCIDCHTVVRLGARKFRGRGIGLFVTWWGDLGNGRAGDEKWANIARPTENIHGGGRVKYRCMDIINAFEGGNTDYVDFDGLSSRADRKELLRLSPYRAGLRK
jgi:hypothetical protein